MGLFDKKEKIKEAEIEAKIKETEERIVQSLQKIPLLEEIDKRLARLKAQEPWVITNTGYYDNCGRKVVFKKDAILIQAYEVKTQKTEKDQNGNWTWENVEVPVREIPVCIYTQEGYTPLYGCGEYVGKDGFTKNIVSTTRASCLWAPIVREHVMAEFKECEFGDVEEGPYPSGDETTAYFKYEVPRLEFKQWY